MPEAPDRKYVENSMVECWERELRMVGNATPNKIVSKVEDAYRVGTPIAELVDSACAWMNQETNNDSGTDLSPTVYSRRDAFKWIVNIFAFNRYSYFIKNPLVGLDEVNIIHTLSPAQGTMFSEFSTESEEGSKQTSINQPLDWLGTQAELAALLVTLRDRGWISSYKPYSTIKAVFSNAKTIDQILRPEESDGKATYPRIKAMDFKKFESIREKTNKK